MHIYTYTCKIHTEVIIKTSEDFFKKYTSHFVCVRDLETEQRLQHIDLPRPSGHSHVSFTFSLTAQTGGLEALTAGCCLSTAYCF